LAEVNVCEILEVNITPFALILLVLQQGYSFKKIKLISNEDHMTEGKGSLYFFFF